MPHAKLLPIPFVIWLAGCGERDVVASREPSPAFTASVVTATSHQWPSIYEVTGTVRARTLAIISAKWMGYVREVKVQVGDRVREGQSLVSLDTRDLDANANRAVAAREEVRSGIAEAESGVAIAKANLELAQITFKRMKSCMRRSRFPIRSLTRLPPSSRRHKRAYEMARAKRAQLDSKLAQADQEVRGSQVTRSYAEIHAPFAGVVTAKSVDPGNLAVPGAPLLTIEREGAYRLEASVEESHLSAIRVGQSVSLRWTESITAFDARVSEIVPAVDAASRSYTVKIDLPAVPTFRSGAFGRALFSVGSPPVARYTFGGRHRTRPAAVGICGRWNGIARTRLITVGQKAKDQVEVLSGLNAGEKVIFPVPHGLSDGARVEVRP